LIAEGFTQREVEQLEAQTGNILQDLLDGKVPRGNGKSSAVWSLLSLILSVIAVIITVLLVIGSLARRRNGDSETEYSVYGRDETEKRRRRGRLLKLLTCIVGILTLIIWLVLDDTSLPMAWFNRYTPIVAVFFIVHLALFAVYRIRRSRQGDDTESETGSAAS
jgi:amino acid transporter